MKRPLLLLCFLAYSVISLAQFTGLEVEVYQVHTGVTADGVDLTGFTTYRLWVNMTNENDMLFSVVSSDTSSTKIESTTSFFQSPGGGLVGPDIYPQVFSFIPSAEWDSWVTIGRASSNDSGGMVYTLQNPTNPWTDAFSAGNDIILDGLAAGSWFSLYDSGNGLAGPDLKVLIGQFTTDGEFSGEISCQIYVMGDEANIENVDSFPFEFNFQCNDINACNYDPESVSSEDCVFVFGCLDDQACNYNIQACTDDGTCNYTCGCYDPLATNFNPGDIGTEDCIYIEGCTDPSSCLYNPLAVIDIGCNELLGCMDELASNFDPMANCSQNCIYTIQGHVWYDVDINGILNSNEPGLADQIITAEPGGYTTITDSNGNFSLELPEGEFEITVELSAEYPTITSGANYFYSTSNVAEFINIGLSYSDLPVELVVYHTFPIGSSGLACDEQPNEVSVTIFNYGDVAVTGNVWFPINEINALGGSYYPISPLDSVDFDFAYIDFGTIPPLSAVEVLFGILGPLPFSEGQILDIGTTAMAYVNGEYVAQDTEYSPVQIMCDCSDPEACNYAPSNYTGSCVYTCGCNDPLATNFNPDDIGTTECIYSIQGTVFFDADANGEFDDGEIILPQQLVTFAPSGFDILTDNSGQFSVLVSEGDYTFSVITSPEFPITTTAATVNYSTGSDSGAILFGLSYTEMQNSISVNTYTPNLIDGIICNEYINPVEIWVTNEGNTPLNGYIKIFMDELISPQGFQQISVIDSVVGEFAFIGFEQINPGSSILLETAVLGPLNTFEGQWVDLSTWAYGTINNTVVCSDNNTAGGTVVCGFDPNDKQVQPQGYAAPHYIAQDTLLTYFVQFQNTGSYTAFDILIIDSISEYLDLSTFQLESHSHNVQTNIDQETKTLQFLFDNINLPDSLCCEQDSHGMVSYSIRPLPDLPHNTLIENTAYIYFDLNPAIVTNTTWNTIFICDENFVVVESSGTELCEGEIFISSADGEYIESYEWLLNNEQVGVETTFSFEPVPGTYDVVLNASNPICENTEALELEVYSIPQANFSSENNILTATEGSTYQWYLNGEAIKNATQQNYEITEDGFYSVEIGNAIGCIGLSPQIFATFIGITEASKENLFVYPIPVVRGETIYLSGQFMNNAEKIMVYDLLGKMIYQQEGYSNRIPVANWEAGLYTLEIIGQKNKVIKKILVE